MPQTLFALSIRLALRIALVWAGGLLFAVAARALLPDKDGFTFTSPQSTRFLPYSQVGFWTCVLAALTVSAMVVIRTMIVDLGFRAPR